MDRNHFCIERHELVDISPIFLATNFYEQVKNMDYLKIKKVNLVSHVPFVCFLRAINFCEQVKNMDTCIKKELVAPHFRSTVNNY